MGKIQKEKKLDILVFRNRGSSWRTLPAFEIGENNLVRSGASIRAAVLGLQHTWGEVKIISKKNVEPGLAGWWKIKDGKRPRRLPKFS